MNPVLRGCLGRLIQAVHSYHNYNFGNTHHNTYILQVKNQMSCHHIMLKFFNVLKLFYTFITSFFTFIYTFLKCLFFDSLSNLLTFNLVAHLSVIELVTIGNILFPPGRLQASLFLINNSIYAHTFRSF